MRSWWPPTVVLKISKNRRMGKAGAAMPVPLDRCYRADTGAGHGEHDVDPRSCPARRRDDILLLLAVVLLRDAGRAAAGRNCALFLLSAAGYAVCSAPGGARLDEPLGFSLLIVSLGLPALFWMAAAAVFDDAFKPSGYRGFAWLGLVALGMWSVFANEPRVSLA